MKKVLTGTLICMSLISYGYTNSTVISNEAGNLSRAEERIIEQNNRKRDKLLSEISKLESDYQNREEMTEKLRMDSEVRWKRDEYQKMLKKYDTVQTNTQKEIEKKQKELSVIEKGLGIMSAGVME